MNMKNDLLVEKLYSLTLSGCTRFSSQVFMSAKVEKLNF